MHKRAAASQRLVQVWAQTRMRAAADYSYSTTGSACMPHIPQKAHGGPCAFRVRRTMEALLLRRKRWFCGHSALKSTSRSSSALVAMSPARLIAPSVAATPRASTAGLLSAPFTTISAPACPAET